MPSKYAPHEIDLRDLQLLARFSIRYPSWLNKQTHRTSLPTNRFFIPVIRTICGGHETIPIFVKTITIIVATILNIVATMILVVLPL